MQIFYSLSERHNHVEFKPSDITPDGDLGQLVTVLFLVLDHAHCLPRMHRHQEDQEHTSLLLVSPPLPRALLARMSCFCHVMLHCRMPGYEHACTEHNPFYCLRVRFCAKIKCLLLVGTPRLQ